MIYFYIYLGVAMIGSIVLARRYWLRWRSTPSKYNVMFERKQVNRIVDSYIFVVAYMFYVLLFPIALIEIGYDMIKKKRGI